MPPGSRAMDHQIRRPDFDSSAITPRRCDGAAPELVRNREIARDSTDARMDVRPSPGTSHASPTRGLKMRHLLFMDQPLSGIRDRREVQTSGRVGIYRALDALLEALVRK